MGIQYLWAKGIWRIAKINIAVICQQEPELVFDLFLKYVSLCAIYMPNYLYTHI